MTKNILVTGGAGYIGSHFLNLIIEKNNYHPIVVDNLSNGRRESVVHGTFYQADIGDDKFMDELFSKYNFEAIVHFAGSIIVPESVSDPLKYYENNVVNSLKLLNLCQKFKVNQFIFSSTAAVYGDIDGGICDEASNTIPINPYGRTKLFVEKMIEDYARASSLRYVIFRYFNVAGASYNGKVGQCSKNSSHLLKIASEVVVGKREKLVIFGTDYSTKDGTCIRDYIHVDDLAQAHIEALDYLGDGGKSNKFNIGYGVGHSVKEIVETVRKISPKEIAVEIGGRREGDVPILMAKSELIKETIGWTPKYNNIEFIIKSAIDWEQRLQ